MRALTAGSEIDAWCTRCRLDLGHRIVAMVGGAPKRVICQTCGSQHNYRAPRSEPAKKAPSRKAAGATRRADQPARETWTTRCAGQPASAFTPYTMKQSFASGELLEHPRFGTGFVREVRQDSKVVVVFRDAVRTLTHRQG
jgi:hypothetical protein